jgi:alpha-tubulin suppressor-like RCC1 family protein
MVARKGTRTVLFTTLALVIAQAAIFSQEDDTQWRNAMQEAGKARQSGQLQEVERLLKTALTEAEKFGPVDQRVVLSLDALGTYYYTQGIFIEAVPIYTRLLGIRERTLGPNHPAVASSMNDLAMIESIQGKHAEAAATSEKALQIVERAAAGIQGVQILAAGANHTCALLESGGVECWGSNLAGQFGIPGAPTSAAPVDVPKVENGVAVAAGLAFTCALHSDQTVTCWGANDSGQSGAPPSQTAEPTKVAGIANAKALAAGAEHACALLAEGALKCWGNNQQGQLGNGMTANSHSPVTVSGLTGAKAVAAGGNHSCALAADGGVWCWGSNQSGETGTPGTEPALSPVQVPGLTAPATSIAAGGNHTCALLSEGTVACWGRNQSGQVGMPASAQALAPTKVQNIALVTALFAGYSHTCALLADSTARCWGNNQEGQLGDGKTLNASTPVAVAGLTGVTGLAAGIAHTCALLVDKTFRCWGTDSYGAPTGLTFSLRSREPVEVGRPHAALVIALNILAGIYRAGGKLDKAEPLYQRALNLGEKVHGPTDLNLVPILSGYAEMLRKAGRAEEAGKLDARAQAIQTRPEKLVLTDVPTAPPPPR